MRHLWVSEVVGGFAALFVTISLVEDKKILLLLATTLVYKSGRIYTKISTKDELWTAGLIATLGLVRIVLGDLYNLPRPISYVFNAVDMAICRVWGRYFTRENEDDLYKIFFARTVSLFAGIGATMIFCKNYEFYSIFFMMHMTSLVISCSIEIYQYHQYHTDNQRLIRPPYV